MTGDDGNADRGPEPSHELMIRSWHAGNGVVCEVAGEIDLLTAGQFRTGLGQAVLDKSSVLVVDLSGVTFLGSMGVSVLVEAHQTVGPGVLRVVTGDGVSRRAIEVMGLDQVLAIFATVDDALGTDG
jgi:anti-sigma B factor antagonist